MVENSYRRKSVEEKSKEENGFIDVSWWIMKLLEIDLLDEVVGGNVVGKVSLWVRSLDGAAD